jgi:signal transduction histidine kinase
MARPAERYQLIERLGGGACGSVHRALDRSAGHEIALRLAPRRHGRPNLRDEMIAQARVKHPALAGIHDYGVTDAGSEYVAMELLAGKWQVAALGAAWFAGWDTILDGLGALHGRGLAHGNLRPSSLLAAADGAPRLVDGGLVRPGLAAAAVKQTIAYVAPEAWSRPPDPRADLYAVGALLYQQLTTVPGFGGTDPRNLIAAQRRTAPPPLRELRPDAPPALDALVAALCAPSPSGRPQHTDEVRDTLAELAAGLGISIRPLRASDGERRAPSLTTTAAIGRDRELGDLERIWRDARAGRGGAAALIGEAGMGTSQLLGQLAVQAELDGAVVVELTTTGAGGVTEPFSGITELVRALTQHAPSDAVTDPVQRAALAAVAAGRPLPADTGRWTVAEGAVEVAIAIAGVAPLLILIDDLSRASVPATELICYLARATADAAILVVAAGRPPPPGQTSPVTDVARAIASCVRGVVIDVPPLSRSAITQLVDDATHRDVAAKIGDEIHRASGGNPGTALAILELMAQTGQIARVRGRWIADAEVTVPLPRSPLAAARAHLAQLPAQSRAVLRAAGALGPAFDRVLLGQALGLLAVRPTGRDTEVIEVIGGIAAGDTDLAADGIPAVEMDEDMISVSVSVPMTIEPITETEASRQLAVGGTMDGVEAALAAGVTAGLLVADPAAGRFRFVDPALARELGDELDQASARIAHERAREALRDRYRNGDPGAAAELATQCRALGEAPEAVGWSLIAADAEAGRGDPRAALARLNDVVVLADGERLGRLTARMSQLARQVGDLDAAIRYDRLAIATAGDRTGQLAIELADHYRARGELDTAAAMAHEGLGRARSQRHAGVQARAYLALARIEHARSDPRAAAELVAAGLELAIAGSDSATRIELDLLAATMADAAGEPRRAWAALDDALTAALRLIDPRLRAQVRHERGKLAILHGEYGRARTELDDAVTAAFAAGDLEQGARSLNNLGAAQYYLGAWGAARAAWERFRRLAERAGADAQLGNALNNLGSLYRDLGLFDEGRAVLERGAEVSARTGNPQLAAMIVANLGEVDAREGDFARASERYAAARTEFERLEARGDVIETRRRQCELDLVLGRHDDALGRAIDAIRDARDAGARLEEGILHRVAARAARMCGDLENLESARWFVDRARERLTAHGVKYELARAIEEDAAVAEAEGDDAAAERLRDEARRIFTDLGARWDLARLRPAQVQPAAIGRTEIDAVADVGRSVAGLDVSRALAAGVERIAQTGRFERALVIGIDDEGRPQELHRWIAEGARVIQRGDAMLIAPLVRRVAATGVADAAATATRHPDLHRLGVERVLCAPLRVGGHVLGVIYLDASRPGDGDGVDPIVEATTTLLGLALDRNRLAGEARRRGDLMSILAHEIRNPLSGILGYAEIGTEDELGDPGQARQLLIRIRADGERLRRLLEDVMALAKREPRGKEAGAAAAVDVAALARDVATSFWASCEQRAVALAVEASAPGCTALGNTDQLGQVLTNVVTNAIKFTPPGGSIKIAVSREAVTAGDPHLPPGSPTDPRAWVPMLDGEPAGEYVRVDVIDSGPGLDPTIGEQLFEKFVQGRQRGRGGLGLGLYISREIIQRHGGTIWAGNAPDGGARFSFRLPVAM